MVGLRDADLFLGIDASSLTGTYTGQLAAATGIEAITGYIMWHMLFLTLRLKITGRGS